MSKSLRLSDLHFHDTKIVNSSLNGSVLKVSFELVLNKPQNFVIPMIEIEFTNISITKIEKDFGNNLKSIQDTVVIQDLIDIFELKPYVYELVELDSVKNHHYEIFLDRSNGDYLPRIYFTFDECKVTY